MQPDLDQQSIGYNEAAEMSGPEGAAPRKQTVDVPAIEQTLVDHIFDLYSAYSKSDYRSKKLKAARKNRRNYDQETDPSKKDFPWKHASSLTLPLVTIAVDNIEPRMVAALGGKGDEVAHFSDVGKEDPEIDALQGWFNTELIHRVKIRETIRGTVHDLCLDGTTFLAADYNIKDIIKRDFKYVLEPVVDQMTGVPISQITGMPITEDGEPVVMQPTGQIQTGPDGEFLTEDYIEPYFEGARLELLDFGDVFFPDNAEDWEEADIVRAVSVPYSDLRRSMDSKVVGYMNIDDDLFHETSITPGAEDDSLRNSNALTEAQMYGRRYVPCLEAHIKWDFQDRYARDTGKWVGEEKIVALVTKTSKKLIRLCLQRDISFSNKKLIRRLRTYPQYGKTCGTAIATKLKDVQEGASDTFNLVLNVATVCMIPWFMYGPTSGLDAKIELKPGQGIPTQDPKAVVFPKFSINPNQFIEFINIFISLWERVSSISDVQVGRGTEISGNKAQTATATMMQVQEANIKHVYSSQQLQEEFAGLLDVIYDLYYMHAPIGMIHEQEGEQKIVSKLSMRRKRRFVLTGTTETANKFYERQEAESLFNTLSPVPFANSVELVMDILRTYDKQNPEKYIDPNINQILQIYQVNPQAVMAAMQQLVVLMQQAEIEQEGGAGNAQQAA